MFFDPNGHVDGQIEDQSEYVVSQPHLTLALRGVEVRLEEASTALDEHEDPCCVRCPRFESQVPLLPAPEQRADYREDVEVGEVVVRDLEAGQVVEEPVEEG